MSGIGISEQSESVRHSVGPSEGFSEGFRFSSRDVQWNKPTLTHL